MGVVLDLAVAVPASARDVLPCGGWLSLATEPSLVLFPRWCLVLVFEEAVGVEAEAGRLVLVSPVSTIWAGRADPDFLDLDLDSLVAD